MKASVVTTLRRRKVPEGGSLSAAVVGKGAQVVAALHTAVLLFERLLCDVRYWPKADILSCHAHVCFWG
jgi:hypothetical protein